MKKNKYKQVVKGMNISKATEDELHDLSMFELIDIILFYREELERKEQECEEWKNKLAKSFADERKKEIIIDQLKKNNEELQEKIKAYDEVYSNHDVLNERNKYKQTLTEIKEFVENEMEQDVNTSIILQKCEVLNEK